MSTQTSSPSRPDVTVTERHGVPHVVVPGAGPVRARLVFRVGMADETVQQRGLTHLVEHLVMRAAGRRVVDVAARTGVWTTEFEAAGGSAEVAAFLEDVWRVLADLPTEALDLERRVLRHEASGRSLPPSVESAHHRFGLTGPGRTATDELGLDGATPASVRAWVRDRFVRGAAAVVATADVRPDLSAELGPGPVHPLPVAVGARGGTGPVWVGDAGGTAVSLLLPASRGTDLAVGRLLLEAAEDAVRHVRALAYEVGLDCLPVSPELTEVTVYAACETTDAVEVAALLVEAVRRLRDEGPDLALLDLDRRRSRLVWTEAHDALETAEEHAVALLTGQAPRSLADRLADVEHLGAPQVQEAVRTAWPTVQVLFPLPEGPGLPDVAECRHDAPPVRGRVHRGNPLAGVLPGARLPLSLRDSLTCGDEGLSVRVAGEVSTVRWDDVAAVLRHTDGFSVLGQDGTSVLVPDGTFLRGRAVRGAVEARVDPSLVVEVAG